MANLFPSDAWAAEYKNAVNANPRYAKVAGKDWTHGAVALIVKADAALQLEQDMAILLDVDAGVCRGASYIAG